MATIGNDGGGKRRILFVASDGTRKTIRLGKMSKQQAESIKSKVESLIAAAANGMADHAANEWTANKIDDVLHDRLARVGLVKPRSQSRLGHFITDYIDGRQDIKPRTKWNLERCRKLLVEHFGEDRDLRTIDADAAEGWRVWMQQQRKRRLGENTTRRLIGRARQLFKVAIRRGLYHGINPFEGMAAAVRADKSRAFFITRDMADKVIAKCPNTTWKMLFALSRYGGLRCPSEHLSLKWTDVDFEGGRIRVPSPKTEHIEGKEERYIPLFPELRPLLDDLLGEQHTEGDQSEFVIARYRDSSTNLRTHLRRIIRKAGLTPWPKLWHNLRASRQTELAEQYPLHVVCAWIGNSRAVAQEHYLTVTDAYFERASRAAQNPAQQAPEMASTGQQTSNPPNVKTSDLPSDAETCLSVRNPNYPRQDSNL